MGNGKFFLSLLFQFYHHHQLNYNLHFIFTDTICSPFDDNDDDHHTLMMWDLFLFQNKTKSFWFIALRLDRWLLLLSISLSMLDFFSILDRFVSRINTVRAFIIDSEYSTIIFSQSIHSKYIECLNKIDRSILKV